MGFILTVWRYVVSKHSMFLFLQHQWATFIQRDTGTKSIQMTTTSQGVCGCMIILNFPLENFH